MNATNQVGWPRTRRQLLLAAGIITSLVLIALIRLESEPAHGHDASVTDQPHYDAAHEKAWDKIIPRLAMAEETSLQAGNKYHERVKAFFAERKQGSRAFSEEVLSLWGKWEFVKSKLSFTEAGGHERYLRETFEHHLFRSEDLANLIESAFTGYVGNLQEIENALLVEIRSDLSEDELTPSDLLQMLRSPETFHAAYAKVLEQVLPVVSRDMKVTVGREVASFIAADIAANVSIRIVTAVTARLGVSAGILGTGTASSVATFGVGLVGALLADMALDWIMKNAIGYDPAAEIERKVCDTLDKVETLLLEGDPDSGSVGLRRELTKLQESRSHLCREALKKLILEGSQP